MDGLAQETHATLHPSRVPPTLLSQSGGVGLGVKALDDSHSKRQGTLLGGSGISCLGLFFFLFFLLRKRENKEV